MITLAVCLRYWAVTRYGSSHTTAKLFTMINCFIVSFQWPGHTHFTFLLRHVKSAEVEKQQHVA